jgi:hypothetical protein
MAFPPSFDLVEEFASAPSVDLIDEFASASSFDLVNACASAPSVDLVTASASELALSELVPEEDAMVLFTPLSGAEQECATYLAGYLARKIALPFKCATCLAALICDSPTGHFVFAKQFAYVKIGLSYPTPQFARVIGEMESVFRKRVTNVCHLPNVLQTMKTVMRVTSHRLFDVLSDHDLNHQLILQDRIETLFLRVRLHHVANVANAAFRQNCSRKAQKNGLN